MLTRLARVFLVCVLLVGWQSALEHPLEHVDELGEFVHLHGGHSDQSGPLCDNLAALTACAAEVLVFLGQHWSDYEAPMRPLRAPRLAEAPPFLSHAPPASA